MQRVGNVSKTLKGSAAFCKCLAAACSTRHVASGRCLFKVDDTNKGVFLMRKGKVALLVEDLPNLDRVFSAGSVLGLPSTFTGNPYGLTARALADSEVVHVPREDFPELMRQDPTLCREASEMLTREISFIQAALAQRKRQKIRRESQVSAVVTPRLVGSPSAGSPQRFQHPWTNGRRHKDRPRA
jgi:CRP-like cAMP-binding protein